MKKKKSLIKTLNILIVIYIVTLSFGYAYFSDNLSINGNVDTAPVYEGSDLPTTPVKYGGDKYVQEVNDKPFLDFYYETWSGNYYTAVFKKKVGITAGEKLTAYNIAFINPTVLDYTEGYCNGFNNRKPWRTYKKCFGQPIKYYGETR